MNKAKSPKKGKAGNQFGGSSSIKRPYSEPLLQSYGKIHQLTRGQTGTMADGGSGMGMP